MTVPASAADDEPHDLPEGAPGPLATQLPDELTDFITHCVPLTGFAAFDLHATGTARLYLDTARRQVGEDRFAAFWTAWKRALAEGHGPEALTPTHREVARALIYLWYTGAWPRLAPAAHADLRRESANTEFVPAPSAYVEGLVWRTFHGHPAGAKPPGFGTWAVRPPDPPGVAELRDRLGLADVPYRTGLAGEVPPEDIPAHLLPGQRLSRAVPPSAVPTAAAAPEATGTPEAPVTPEAPAAPETPATPEEGTS
ncbi:hypothetical protein [Streptomyces bugieae]|uniref:Uncharacterized protein n=1 Tax=Streptomyces bugieae TaxID=3098223 RepID=A0ABU7P0U6_9ACTN|nr:hypothetical protein [Streptomyces sp. DSM 41528]